MHSNPMGIKHGRNFGQMSFLNEEGGLYMPFQTCKETLVYHLTGHLGFNDKTVISSIKRHGKIDIKRPKVIFVIANTQRWPGSISRIQKILDLLSENFKIGHCFVDELEGQKRTAIIRLDPYWIRSATVCHTLLTFIRAAAAAPEIGVSLSSLVKFIDYIKVNGKIDLVRRHIGNTAIVVGNRVIWIEGDRLAAIVDGRIGLALVLIGNAAIDEGFAELRVHLDRFAEIQNGLIEIAFILVNQAPVYKDR